MNEQLPNQVVEKLLLFLDSFNPPAVIVQALSHVGVLAASVDQNVLLEAVIPLILHEDLCVRTKVAWVIVIVIVIVCVIVFVCVVIVS